MKNAQILDLAAKYCTKIVRNHPFNDGNKRTGLAAALQFLSSNGFDFTGQTILNNKELAHAVISIVERTLSESELASLLFLLVEHSPVWSLLNARLPLMFEVLKARKFESSDQHRAFFADLKLSETKMVLIQICETYCIRGDRFNHFDSSIQNMMIALVTEKYQGEFGLSMSADDAL